MESVPALRSTLRSGSMRWSCAPGMAMRVSSVAGSGGVAPSSSFASGKRFSASSSGSTVGYSKGEAARRVREAATWEATAGWARRGERRRRRGQPQGEQVEEEGRDDDVRGGGGGLDGLGGAALELKDWRLGAAHSGWRGRCRWRRRSSVGGSSNQRVEGARARLEVDSSSGSRGRTEGAAR
jgi:hypothetical protein